MTVTTRIKPKSPAIPPTIRADLVLLPVRCMTLLKIHVATPAPNIIPIIVLLNIEISIALAERERFELSVFVAGHTAFREQRLMLSLVENYTSSLCWSSHEGLTLVNHSATSLFKYYAARRSG